MTHARYPTSAGPLFIVSVPHSRHCLRWRERPSCTGCSGATATPGCAACAQGTKQRDDANGREESGDRSREEAGVLVGDHTTAARKEVQGCGQRGSGWKQMGREADGGLGQTNTVIQTA